MRGFLPIIMLDMALGVVSEPCRHYILSVLVRGGGTCPACLWVCVFSPSLSLSLSLSLCISIPLISLSLSLYIYIYIYIYICVCVCVCVCVSVCVCEYYNMTTFSSTKLYIFYKHDKVVSLQRRYIDNGV